MSSKSGFALEDLLAITGWLVLIIGVLGGFFHFGATLLALITAISSFFLALTMFTFSEILTCLKKQ